MQLSDKARRRIKRAAAVLIATTAVLAAFGWAERERNADEEYVVYSAYLSDGLLSDAHDWSVGGPALVVVKDTTTTGGNLRFHALYALDGRIQFDGLRASTRASYLVR